MIFNCNIFCSFQIYSGCFLNHCQLHVFIIFCCHIFFFNWILKQSVCIGCGRYSLFIGTLGKVNFWKRFFLSPKWAFLHQIQTQIFSTLVFWKNCLDKNHHRVQMGNFFPKFPHLNTLTLSSFSHNYLVNLEELLGGKCKCSSILKIWLFQNGTILSPILAQMMVLGHFREMCSEASYENLRKSRGSEKIVLSQDLSLVFCLVPKMSKALQGNFREKNSS